MNRSRKNSTPHDQQQHGIINVTVASMHRRPNFRSEMVNQTLLGTIVRIFEEQHGFYRIENRDGYPGWITKISVVSAEPAAVDNWRRGPLLVCLANHGKVAGNGEPGGRYLVDLVPGVLLKQISENNGNIEVELPDGRRGHVQKKLVVSQSELLRIRASSDNLIEVAKSFIGTPYLWGGTSAKAFDCSGFVQTVFRLNNIELPRDARQMVHEGQAIDPGSGFENLLAGDLMFFGPTPRRIEHVAMYLGEQCYIHSDGDVRINSLHPEHPLFNEFRRRTFRQARRIL